MQIAQAFHTVWSTDARSLSMCILAISPGTWPQVVSLSDAGRRVASLLAAWHTGVPQMRELCLTSPIRGLGGPRSPGPG